MTKLNGYDLSRSWFDFAFENPDKISPNHAALFFFAIENCNRLGWKKQFGLPATMAMEAIGIRSYNTYKKVFDDLVEWGFFKLVQKSKNQYSSNVIALSIFEGAIDKALDKALTKHSTKHPTKQSEYNKTIEQLTLKQGGDDFKPIIDDWLQYKKEKGQAYKPKGLEQFIIHLKALSKNNVKVADAIIKQSMRNNWAGIFELKDQPKEPEQKVIYPDLQEVFKGKTL